jgi:hypothetical protein
VQHEAALVRVLLQVVVLAQSEDKKAEVVGVNVDDHVNGLKLRNKTTQISILKRTERHSKKQKKQGGALISMITSITFNKQMTNDCF